jgi:hypothetical protein
MQHPWWFSVRDLARHLLGSSTLFVSVTPMYVFDSALLEFAGRLIHSRFVFRMLVALEYALLIGDLMVIGIALIGSILNNLKRAQR